MRLKDIFNASGGHINWINFNFKWEVAGDGTIVPFMEPNINMDSEVNVHYQWFWHFNEKLDTKEIWNAIKDHDYETFRKWYDMYVYDNLTYFPSEAAIFMGDECVGFVCVVYSPETFALITSQDYECG